MWLVEHRGSSIYDLHTVSDCNTSCPTFTMSSLESGNVRVVEENVVATADPPGDLGDDPYDDCLEAVFNYTITPQEAAEQIVRLTPSPNMEVASYGLYILWCGIVPRCLTRPEAHPALVDLLVALVNMPDAVGEDGQPLDVHKMRMWQDLPTFGWVMRYWWNCESGSTWTTLIILLTTYEAILHK